MNLVLGLCNFQNWKENWKPLFQSLHFLFLSFLVEKPKNQREKRKDDSRVTQTCVCCSWLSLRSHPCPPLPFVSLRSRFCTAQVVPLTPWLNTEQEFPLNSSVRPQGSWGEFVFIPVHHLTFDFVPEALKLFCGSYESFSLISPGLLSGYSKGPFELLPSGSPGCGPTLRTVLTQCRGGENPGLGCS